MNFLQLLDGAEYVAQQGDPDIAGLDYDSRRVKPGWCFVAMRGETSDGNRYIDAALQAGAVAVVSDSLPPRPEVAWAQVLHGRRALARLSANFYGRPAERLLITGITGTNGKTTTSFLLHAMLRAGGRKAALVGTVEYRIADRGAACAAHHSRGAGAEPALRACGGGRLQRSSHGGFVARAGATADLWRAVRCCGVYEPDSRPSRLSREYGRILRGKDNSLYRLWHRTAQGCCD